jgi:hypothetical protein
MANAFLSAAAAIAGGLIVALSNYWLRRLELLASEHEELRVALTSFLHAIDLLGFEAGRQPRSGRTVNAINRFVARWLPQVDYTTGRLHERIFTPRLRSLEERFTFAANRLVLVAPLELLPQIEAVTLALADFAEPDESWRRRFDLARQELLRAARETLGAPVGERTRETDQGVCGHPS